MKSSQPRKAKHLPNSLQRKLLMYVKAARANAIKSWDRSLLGAFTLAGATGLVVVGEATPAAAKIIYTPLHVVMPGVSSVYSFALNQKGGHDFRLKFVDRMIYGNLSAAALTPGDKVLGSRSVAYALKPGFRVGPKSKIFQDAGYMAGWIYFGSNKTCQPTPGFPWNKAQNRYLGLKFMIGGKAHYGWARLTVSVKGCAIPTTLTGYAYETTPDLGIIAGQTKGPDVIAVMPGSLGRLARGSVEVGAERVSK